MTIPPTVFIHSELGGVLHGGVGGSVGMGSPLHVGHEPAQPTVATVTQSFLHPSDFKSWSEALQIYCVRLMHKLWCLVAVLHLELPVAVIQLNLLMF